MATKPAASKAKPAAKPKAQPQAATQTAPDPAKIQTRIDYLKKNRPNDPEIKQLQAKLTTAQQPTLETSAGNLPISFNPSDPNSVANSAIRTNVGISQIGNQINNPNIENPFGSQTVTYDENGVPTVKQNLATEEEAKYGQENQIEGVANNKILDALNQYQSIWNNPVDFSADRQKVEDSLYNRSAQRLDQQWGDAEKSFEQKMYNRGIPQGSPQYNQMKQQFDQSKSDAYAGARNDAIATGGQEEQRLFGNTMTQRGQGMSEIGGLYGLGMGVMMPNFQQFQGQQVAPTDIASLGQGYYGLALNNQQFNKKLANDQTVARIGASSASTQPDYFAKLNADTQAKKDLLSYQWQNDPQYQQQQKPGVGSAVGGMLGSFGGAFLGGLGQSLGSSWGK